MLGDCMDEILDMTASEIVAATTAATISSVEVTQACLARIESADPHLHAFIVVKAEGALREAARLDELRANSGTVGRLHGVPVAIKDIFDVRGLPTTCHSRIMSDAPASQDAVAVQRLRAAGAVIVGKNALHEFATGGPSFDLPWPPARNPWLPTHHPGGSSSGSGAAVAASMVPVSVGTDTGGSVRHPATVCGITGFKPTYDAISRDGVFPLSPSLDHVGPLARSVEDCALMFAVMADQPTISFSKDDSLKGKRVGIFDDFGQDADPEIAAAFDAAVEALAAMGCTLTPLKAPPLAELTGCARTILHFEAYDIHSQWLLSRPQDYGLRGRTRLSAGRETTREHYLKAIETGLKLTQELDDAMSDVDVAVSVSSLRLPCRIDDEVEISQTYDRQARTPFNLTGAPALSLPIGLSRDGLPIGMQMICRHGRDASLLRFGHAFQNATSWHQARPPLSHFTTNSGV